MSPAQHNRGCACPERGELPFVISEYMKRRRLCNCTLAVLSAIILSNCSLHKLDVEPDTTWCQVEMTYLPLTNECALDNIVQGVDQEYLRRVSFTIGSRIVVRGRINKVCCAKEASFYVLKCSNICYMLDNYTLPASLIGKDVTAKGFLNTTGLPFISNAVITVNHL